MARERDQRIPDGMEQIEVHEYFKVLRDPVWEAETRAMEEIFTQEMPLDEITTPAIIDVGSGPGALRDLAPASHRPFIQHSDIKPNLIEELLRRHPDAAAQVADMTRLSETFPRDWADRIVGLASIDMLSNADLNRAVREMKKVLRPGGKVHFLQDIGANPDPLIMTSGFKERLHSLLPVILTMMHFEP